MTLSAIAKNMLASLAGAGGCFALSGISYTDPDGVSKTGSTADVLNAFVTSNLLGKPNTPIRGGYTYSSFIASFNGNAAMDISDVTWAYNNQYCAPGATPQPGTPTPYPTPSPTGTPTPAPSGQTGGQPNVFEFVTPPSGIPSITLGLATLEMRQNGTDRHFEMNSVDITNNSQWPVYIAAEVRIFQGSLTSCPASGAVFKGLNRTETTSRAVRINTIDPGVKDNLNLDFFQPSNLVGFYTICLYIRGSYVKQDLLNEISTITG